MEYELKKADGYTYIDEGEGHPLVLLHGLFGALSNWMDVIERFKTEYRVIIPMMPIYDMPVISTGVKSLAEFVHDFVQYIKLEDFSLIGNSLGGHVALVYLSRHPENVKHLILTGSSGLYENAMGGSFPRREDYDFIKNKVELTFYDPKSASKELVDEVFEIVNNKHKLIRILALAKSAIRHNMADEISKIKQPTCLIWGKNDTITPPEVGEEFKRLIGNSELNIIDQCGHAPMMEKPIEFNDLLSSWLAKHP